MPPRKSNVSVATNGDLDTSTVEKTPRGRESLGVEDLNMPRTMVGRLAKGVLPPNTQIQKDALLAMSKSVTVFVNFLAANAGEMAQAAGKKTIMPHDVYAALKDQEFEAFVPRVQAEVAKYNEIQSDKRNAYRRTKKAAEQTGTAEGGTEMALDLPNGTHDAAAEGDAEEPPSKKARRGLSDDMDGEGDEEVEVDEEDVVDEDEDSAEEDVEDEIEEDQEQGDGAVEDDFDLANGAGELLRGIRDEALDEPDSD